MVTDLGSPEPASLNAYAIYRSPSFQRWTLWVHEHCMSVSACYVNLISICKQPNWSTDFHITSRYSLAKIWNAPVRKKRPPFWRVNSWQKNRKRDRMLKMIDRIMRAWTAWIQTEKQKAFQNISAFPYSWNHLEQFELRNKNLSSWDGDCHFKWTRMDIKQVIIYFLICYSQQMYW